MTDTVRMWTSGRGTADGRRGDIAVICTTGSREEDCVIYCASLDVAEHEVRRLLHNGAPDDHGMSVRIAVVIDDVHVASNRERDDAARKQAARLGVIT